MKVTLINYTQDAEDVLIFTKNTRLNMSAGAYEDVKKMSFEDKLKELEYMSNTIPSSWEFVDYVFMIEGVSRAFTHQFVRTRTGSYAQQSMRVTKMEQFDYIAGPSIYKNHGCLADYTAIMAEIQSYYNALLEQGATIEDARGILPTNICTNIVAKFNLRTLSEMAKARTGGRTQGEYRDVMNAMVDEVIKVHPWAELFLFPKGRSTFNEIEDLAAQVKEINYDLGQNILKAVDRLRKE